MFNEKELDAAILAYFKRRGYLTSPMIAKECECTKEEVERAIFRIPTIPVCQIWSKKLNMKIWYYTTNPLNSGGKAKSLTSAHKRLQKQWLLQEALRQDLHQQYATLGELIYGINVKLKPQYFLLTRQDAIGIYEKLVNALPKP